MSALWILYGLSLISVDSVLVLLRCQIASSVKHLVCYVSHVTPPSDGPQSLAFYIPSVGFSIPFHCLVLRSFRPYVGKLMKYPCPVRTLYFRAHVSRSRFHSPSVYSSLFLPVVFDLFPRTTLYSLFRRVSAAFFLSRPSKSMTVTSGTSETASPEAVRKIQ